MFYPIGVFKSTYVIYKFLQDAEAKRARKRRIFGEADAQRFDNELQTAKQHLKPPPHPDCVTQPTTADVGGSKRPDGEAQNLRHENAEKLGSESEAGTSGMGTSCSHGNNSSKMKEAVANDESSVPSDDSGARISTFGSEVVTSTPNGRSVVAEAASTVTSPSETGSARSSFNAGVEGHSLSSATSSSDITAKKNAPHLYQERPRGLAPIPPPRRGTGLRAPVQKRTSEPPIYENVNFENGRPDGTARTPATPTPRKVVEDCKTPTRPRSDSDSSVSSQRTVKRANRPTIA